MSIEAKVKMITKDIDYEPEQNGIHLTNLKTLKERVGINNRYDSDMFWFAIQDLLNNPKMNAYTQLMKWRSLGKQMVAYCRELEDIAVSYHDQLQRLNSLSFERSGQRWTDEEDGSLIELVCNDDVPMVEMCAIFGRTPAAISTRVSYLVGIKRISSEVAGKFVGTLNGAKIEGNIKGQLQKF